MTLSKRALMRSFAGATEWLNFEPLGPAELKGHSVLQRTSNITFVEPGAEAYAFTRLAAARAT